MGGRGEALSLLDACNIIRYKIETLAAKLIQRIFSSATVRMDDLNGAIVILALAAYVVYLIFLTLKYRVFKRGRKSKGRGGELNGTVHEDTLPRHHEICRQAG